MAQSTPGRRARDDKYLPFNPNPKDLGTRSGIAMPKDVLRTADGYEEPSEFFRSPGTVVDGDQTVNFSSFGARTPRTPGSRSAYTAETPGTTGTNVITPGNARRSTRARMSDLDSGMEDEDQDGMQTEDLLVDEDELEMATPGQYFPNHDPPSVTLPSRSRLQPASPQVDLGFDNIPSPSRRTRSSPRKPTTIGVNYKPSPAKSALSRLQEEDGDASPTSSPRGGEDISTQDLDDTMASQALASSPLRSTQTVNGSLAKNRKSPNRSQPQNTRRKTNGNAAAEPEHEEDDEEADVGHARDRMSLASRRSNVTRNGAEDDEDLDESDNDNAPETFEYDDAMDDYGESGADASLMVDDTAAGGGPDEDEDEGVELEEQAMAAEERSEDEEEQEEVEERAVVKKKGRPKNAPQPVRTRNRETGVREGSVAPKPKKTRVSQIGVADESDTEDGYHGNFVTRRSQRQHFKPLAFWRGEKFEYQPGPGLAVIKELIEFPEEPHKPLGAQKRSRSGRSVSAAPAGKATKKKQRGDSEEGDYNAEEGWDNQTDPTGIIVAYPGHEEIHRKIAAPKKLLEPKMVQGGTFKYQKVFGEGQFMAAGVVYIPPGQKKATKPSKDNAYVFHVIQGAVQVTIHRTSFVMAPGGQFLVPRGNEYCIENISLENKEVQLFFAQARKIRAGEEDMEGRPDIVIGSSVPPQGRKGKKMTSVRAGSENESEEGSGGDTEREVVTKAKKGARKSVGARR
ncbi:hypothetical protein IAR55_002550 [Kwoniella newhampshirensis]|uniref:CENP-C homolog n=1 Tax=Kwoniella newhampshirensis TaxID=1651941 RepID=A0AAW0Z1T1_9TREE